MTADLTIVIQSMNPVSQLLRDVPRLGQPIHPFHLALQWTEIKICGLEKYSLTHTDYVQYCDTD